MDFCSKLFYELIAFESDLLGEIGMYDKVYCHMKEIRFWTGRDFQL